MTILEVSAASVTYDCESESEGRYRRWGATKATISNDLYYLVYDSESGIEFGGLSDFAWGYQFTIVDTDDYYWSWTDSTDFGVDEDGGDIISTYFYLKGHLRLKDHPSYGYILCKMDHVANINDPYDPYIQESLSDFLDHSSGWYATDWRDFTKTAV